MKKRQIATTIAMAGILAITPAALAACSGDHYSEIKFAAQDTKYAVTSQGGSVVAYGNYVYFINGSRGYDDTNGKANVWDEVVKGALYRAELNGSRSEDNAHEFNAVMDTEGLEFKYTKDKDYFDNEINVVGTTKIAPKTIGTAGYSNGGIFIYDNAVFFASPNNEKNKTGTVQTTSTDFFMLPLSGGKPTKIYTTTEKVDTSSSAYAFYKYNGSVYLVVNEGSNIISVKINPTKAKVEKPVTFKVNATSVYFPVRDTYYNGISTDTPEDFIYFVRPVKDGETQKSGTVIEAMRPDGSENFKVSMSGATETIEAVRDGMLFYRTTGVGTTGSSTFIKYTNLHNALMDYSPSYKKAQNAKGESANSNIEGTFPTEIDSTMTYTYAFRSDLSSNEVFFVAVTGSAITLYQNDKTNPIRNTVSYGNTGAPQFISNNYLYYAGSNSDYYRVPLFSHMDGAGEPQLLAEGTSTATFGCDYAAGYFSYFGEVDDWASGYSYFLKVDGAEGLEAQFVGQRASSDIPSDKELEELKKGETDSAE